MSNNNYVNLHYLIIIMHWIKTHNNYENSESIQFKSSVQ